MRPIKHTSLRLTALFALINITLSFHTIAETYRYKDDNGKWVYTERIPTRYLKQGYDILDSNMFIDRQVPRAKTDKEIAKFEQQKKQITLDEKLLMQYGSVDNLESMRTRSMVQIDSKIGIIKGNMGTSRQGLEKLQTKAAKLERAGRALTADVTDELKRIQASIDKLQQRIQEQQQEKSQLNKKYDTEKERLLFLTQKNRR